MRSPINEDIAPREVTSEICPSLHCRSAWETSVGRFVEFELVGDAEYWHTVLGDDSRRNERMLVDFSGRDLTREEIRNAVDTLFLNRDWT
ncbi:hypothetical protein [Micrococcus endophyticus]|uniref:hypothetical protein n=1 Tax=Micrococcus endophyticus TaxID=455343 RepID=UPI0034CFEC64